MQPSIAERVAYGTPEEHRADTHVHLRERSTAALVGRILMSAIFLISGVTKLLHVHQTMGYMQSAHIPNSATLVYIAAAAEILGGLALLLGFLTRLAAICLFIYLIPTTWYFHAFWRFSGQEAAMQQINLLKNLAIMGGLLALFAHGPGRFSIDRRIRGPKLP